MRRSLPLVAAVALSIGGGGSEPFDPSTATLAGTWDAVETFTWVADAYQGGNVSCTTGFQIQVAGEPESGGPGVLATITVRTQRCLNNAGQTLGGSGFPYAGAQLLLQRQGDKIALVGSGGVTLLDGAIVGKGHVNGRDQRGGGWSATW